MMTADEEIREEERLKLTDYLTAHITEAIEKRVEARTQKNWQLIRILMVVIAVILAPAAWFSIKTIVRQEVERERAGLLKTVDNIQLTVNNNTQELKKFIDGQLQYINFANQATIMNLQPSVSASEVQELMGEVDQVVKIPGIMNQKTLPFVLDNVVGVLVKFGYENYLEHIEQLFPTIIDKSEDINKKFITYYGRKILSITNLGGLQQTKYYPLFQQRVHIAESNNSEQDSLPFQILVQFHLDHNLRSTKVDNLLNSVNNLSIRKRAIVLWNLMRNTNPRFWQKNPSPSDFRISKIVNNFIKVYRTPLLSIAHANGVKETILELYENANTPEDQKLGKYIINYFYKIPLS
ncbi:MAG: hypothetical protein PVG30_05475 [Gammaproteobacteria bacterium]|jgi:hypothetical protein